MKLKNKIAVITGASEGLGLALAKKLITEGVVVHNISRNKEKFDIAQQEIASENFINHVCDISNYEDVVEAISEIGDFDILVNNAGIWYQGSLEETEYEKIESVIDINSKGVIFMTKASIDILKSKSEAIIINVSSTSGLKGRANESLYCASKFAVRGFTDALYEEYKNTNIKVVGFYPGGMNTKFFAQAGFPKDNQDWMDVADVAEVLFLAISQDNSLITNNIEVNKRGAKVSH